MNINNNIERFNADLNQGLSSERVLDKPHTLPVHYSVVYRVRIRVCGIVVDGVVPVYCEVAVAHVYRS